MCLYCSVVQLTNDINCSKPEYVACDIAIFLANVVWLQQTWIATTSTTGAGIDSFFEYVAKAYILLGDDEYYRVWSEAYGAAMKWLRSSDGFWVYLVLRVEASRQ